MTGYKGMWLWCKIKKNIPKIQIPFWNMINRITFLFNNVSCEKGLRSRGKVYVYNGDAGQIYIGKNVCLNSADWANPIGSGNHIWIQIVGRDAVLSIGDETGISNTAITCATKVEIGKQCLIGSGCKIYDTDFHVLPIQSKEKRIKSDPIVIEDRVFIGAGSTILKGVRVGKNSVIGAGSVVVKDIPAYEVWAGNPARFIKKCV